MTDYALGTTIYIAFTTRAFATGIPTQLAGSPVLSVLESNNATPITSGVSVSVDRASVTGLNEATIVATGGNGYESGKSYSLYISTGTVGGVSVVGEVVGAFTIEAASALRPTTTGRTLDVSVGGEAGVDWANVGSPTTSLALTGTTIATTQKVDVETIKTNPVANGGTVTFPTNATLASTTNITAGTIATVTTLTNLPAITANWLTAAGIAADAGAEIADAVWDEALAGHAGAGSAGEALSAAGTAGDPWTTALPGAYGAGTAGKIIGDNINATISSRASSTDMGTALGYIDTEVAAILADTNELQTDWANGGRLDVILDARSSQISVDDLPTNAELSTALGTADDAVLAAIAALNNLSQANVRTAIGLASANLDTQLDALPTAVENADALIGRNVAGGSSTGRTVKEALYFLRNKWTISGGTLTVYGVDDVTSAWTASITQTAGDPVSASDPA